jgi:hypothetical protein
LAHDNCAIAAEALLWFCLDTKTADERLSPADNTAERAQKALWALLAAELLKLLVTFLLD